jgi:hydrogenase nickel incorporation protein HypA/HybF
VHELGISRNIVAIVSEAARGRPVRRVTLEIGKLSGIVPHAIAFCFEAAAHGTAAQGAALEIREIEGRARCGACEREFAVESLLTPCICGCRRLAYLAGQELKVKTMELEEAP